MQKVLGNNIKGVSFYDPDDTLSNIDNICIWINGETVLSMDKLTGDLASCILYLDETVYIHIEAKNKKLTIKLNK